MAEHDSRVSPGAQWQSKIYQRGLLGQTPAQPVSPDELEQSAKKELKAEAFDYLAGGAGGEDTIRGNREAFQRWRIVPRFLRNVTNRDLSVDLLGLRLPAPVLLAPIGVQGILHKKAELAVARATRAIGVP